MININIFLNSILSHSHTFTFLFSSFHSFILPFHILNNLFLFFFFLPLFFFSPLFFFISPSCPSLHTPTCPSLHTPSCPSLHTPTCPSLHTPSCPSLTPLCPSAVCWCVCSRVRCVRPPAPHPTRCW